MRGRQVGYRHVNISFHGPGAGTIIPAAAVTDDLLCIVQRYPPPPTVLRIGLDTDSQSYPAFNAK